MHRPTYEKKRPLIKFKDAKGRERLRPLYEDFPLTRALQMGLASVVNPMLPWNVCGWRTGGSVAVAVRRINATPGKRIKFDIVEFFDSVDQDRLKKKCDRLDPTWWPRLSPWIPRHGGLAGGVHFAHTLGNLFLLDLDRRFPQAIRYCDNIMICDDNPERVYHKMRRHLNDIGLEVHEFEENPRAFCKTEFSRKVVRRPVRKEVIADLI